MLGSPAEWVVGAVAGTEAPPWRISPQRELSATDVVWLRETLGTGRFDSLPLLARSAFSRVARARLSCGPVVIKRYRHFRAARLLTFGRRSLAEREAEAMERVARALPECSVWVLGWGEQRRGGLVLQSFLVTTELPESVDLRQVKLSAPDDRRRMITAVLESLPAQVARLHAAGIFARSLRGKNVLLQPERGRFALIDLPRSRRPRRLTARHRRYDLACLSLELCRFLSPAQWQAFLASYLGAARLSAAEGRSLDPARIAVRADRIAHRTPLSAARRSFGRWFRGTRLGRWALGSRRSQIGS